MEGIKIEVTGNMARVTRKPMTITSGTVGMPAEFSFDSAWDGLGKTAVFTAGNEKRIVPIGGGAVTIPWEVLEVPKMWLSVGVYGTNADGTIVIPTIWENVCVIRAGADAGGDPSADPTLPIWDQLNAVMEKLRDDIESGAIEGKPGKDGEPGKDGFSPSAKVTQTDRGAVITITDANGTTEVTLEHGRDGNDGATVEEVLEAIPQLTGLDLSDFENGTFTEIIDGNAYDHAVTFDSSGRPIRIDGIVITWGGEPGKEPVAYLYNGTRLPKLPEWDKTAYPYAVLRCFLTSSYYLDCYSQKPEFYISDLSGQEILDYENQEWTQYRFYDTLADWEHNWTGTSDSQVVLTTNTIIWTNFDIKNKDNEGVYFPKSPDPVPVYE